MKKYENIENDIPQVNEPVAMYYYISNNIINNTYIEMLHKLIGFNDTIIANWLNVTTRTLRNYKSKNTVLKDNTKEHIVSILSLYRHGIEVFNTKENFEKWLATENILLSNKQPKDFLDTISGIRLIDNRLTAIEFGENA